jgi:ATP-dependent RNA helicase DDX19/DBP5
MSDTTKPPGSLADRITQPTPSSLNGSSSTFTPAATTSEAKEHPSWADEVASPVAGDDKSKQLGGQVDGATEPLGGSQLHDAQFDVEVKLSDIQGDVNSPLFSISSFEDLGM